MENANQKVLIVEDSALFASAIVKEIENQLTLACVVADSFQQARELVESGTDDFRIAILDLTLPDAPDGEIVDYVISHGIPAIVITGDFTDDTREHILKKDVVDYIIKEGPSSLDQLVNVIRRIQRNQSSKILVVDDSKVSRLAVKRLLETQRITVIEAADGRQALEQLEKHPDVKIVVTDYNMPEMDGFELSARIREKHPMDKLAIIGLSAHGNSLLSAGFLKQGANDFLVKPYANEEFFWRVNQNIEMLHYIESLKKSAIEDYLTGLYNRRHFFSVGEKLFQNARRSNLQLTTAMFDIDHFKKINDTYGHGVGDLVIKNVADILTEGFRSSDLICRFGGEEFCLLAANMRAQETFFHFEQIRKTIAEQPFTAGSDTVAFTISIGVTTRIADTLEETINRADELLYQAKEEGRNRVILE
jgi:diguanylate cyclase (GGDEF)-like protein